MRYRKLRMQDQLREEVSSIIQREIKDPGIGFVTIVEVKLTDDLKIAKVYCSVYGDEEEKKKSLEALKRSRGFIRFLIGQRLALRHAPEFNFVLDDAYERAARIEEILRKEAHAQED